VWSYEQIRDWLAVELTDKLAHEDPKNIKTPKMSIAGPVLLNLHFCKDEEELKEMYAALLASSMTEARAGGVHPSFVHIIQQLSSIEARLLQWLALHHRSGTIFIQKLADDGEDFGTKSFDVSFRELCKRAGLPNLRDRDSYLDNLLRLQLLYENTYTDTEYLPLRTTHHSIEGPSVRSIDVREVWVTDLGRRFMDTCVTTHQAKGI